MGWLVIWQTWPIITESIRLSDVFMFSWMISIFLFHFLKYNDTCVLRDVNFVVNVCANLSHLQSNEKIRMHSIFLTSIHIDQVVS